MGRPCDCTKNILCCFCHEWTDEPPIEPGFYWIAYRVDPSYNWKIDMIRFESDGSELLDHYGDSWGYWKKYEAKRSLHLLQIPEFKQE